MMQTDSASAPLNPQETRKRVLPALDSVVVLPTQGHSANLRAPDDVATVITAFAARVGPGRD